MREACERVAGADAIHARGAGRTAREWYGCELRPGDATGAPCAWRRDSRFECTFAGEPVPGALDTIGAALSGAIVSPG